MNVKKFIAKTTRECFRMMREELGDDAMILSSRQVAQGIEMVAMPANEVDELVGETTVVAQTQPLHFSGGKLQRALTPLVDEDDDLDSLRQVAQQSTTESTHWQAARRTPQKPNWEALAQIVAEQEDNPFANIKPSAHAPFKGTKAAAPKPHTGMQARHNNFVERSGASKELAAAPAQGLDALLQAQARVAQKRVQTNPQIDLPVPQENQSSAIDTAVLNELKNMRAMLQEQRTAISWRDSTQRNPLRASLWSELTEAGFSAAYARAIVEKLPDDYSAAAAHDWLNQVLLHNLHCATATGSDGVGDDMLSRGGTYALVGPTGVGKTTTTAKLAAHCVMRWGVQSLGLITTDSYRIGAQDQLRVYGKILNVPMYTAHTTAELQSMLGLLAQKKLILIDTVGMGQRDSRVPEQLAMLSDPGIQRILVLNAAAQTEVLEDVVRTYNAPQHGRGLSGALISKLDEAMKIGGVLDTLMRHKLRLHYVSNGQRVPEDFHPAQAPMLIQRALQVSNHPVFSMNEDERAVRLLDRQTLSTAL